MLKQMCSFKLCIKMLQTSNNHRSTGIKAVPRTHVQQHSTFCRYFIAILTAMDTYLFPDWLVRTPVTSYWNTTPRCGNQFKLISTLFMHTTLAYNDHLTTRDGHQPCIMLCQEYVFINHASLQNITSVRSVICNSDVFLDWKQRSVHVNSQWVCQSLTIAT